MPVWLLAFRLKLILEKLIELTMVGNLGSNGRHRTLVLRIVAAREKTQRLLYGAVCIGEVSDAVIQLIDNAFPSPGVLFWRPA